MVERQIGGVGLLIERLRVQRNDPPTLSVVSLTRSSTTATVTTAEPHGYSATDYVTIAGCEAPATGFNAKWKIVTVPTPTTFTFTCSSGFPTSASGPMTVIYTSNAQGGQGKNFWRTVLTIPAEMIPLKAMERLQIQAVQSDVEYRFRVRARPDFRPSMRLLWTPTAPQGSPEQTLTITGILPCEDGRTYQYLEAAKVSV